MTDPDAFFSHAEFTIYELRKCLELIIIAHETGRHEPLQAAIEAAVIKVAELGMPSFTRTALQGDMP